MGALVGTVGLLGLAVVATVVLASGRRPLSVPGPRLDPDVAAVILTRAGFPVTAHNVLAVREHLGETFLEQARPGVRPERWDEFQAACEQGRADMATWPQHVLDRIAEADAPAAAGIARRAQAAVLATVGTGRGLLGGSFYEPLPRALA